jgi:hypothetical protein
MSAAVCRILSLDKDKVKKKASMNCKMVFSISKEDLTEELKDFQSHTIRFG